MVASGSRTMIAGSLAVFRIAAQCHGNKTGKRMIGWSAIAGEDIAQISNSFAERSSLP